MALKKRIKQLFGDKNIESVSEKFQKSNNQVSAENIVTGTDSLEKTGKKESKSVIQKSSKNRTSALYHLIILDESGSMSGVTGQTISGCNETLNGIRIIAKEDKETRQFVSIYCFDTSNSRYLFKNKPIECVNNLTSDDYSPNACTPLYDAIGLTVNELKKIATDSDAVAKVTIITDGYENASRQWNHSSVVELIENLKKKGWLFTFIGANIDVEQTSRSLGIDSYMEFKKTDEGMRDMFECERRSQRAYAKKMSYMRRQGFFAQACEEEREQMLGSMNDNYFTEGERVVPGLIRTLAPDEIFVFGSNIHGLHNGGEAGFAAINFGAIMGQAEGIQGQSYAIPSVGNSFAELKGAIKRFTEYVVLHPKQKFMLTAIGCGNAGYTLEQIAPLFKNAYEFGNVYVPKAFLPYVE
jgi:hypothetical protein